MALLVAAAATDVKRGKIYNAVTYPAIAIALIGHTLAGGVAGDSGRLGLWGSLLGLVVGFAPLLAAWAMGGIGGGDAKIMAAVGALMGWKFAIAALFYGLIAAVIMAFIVMIRRRILVRTMVRILRFVYLAFTPSRGADPATPQSPKIPFGLALCIGAAAELIFEALKWGGAAQSVFGM